MPEENPYWGRICAAADMAGLTVTELCTLAEVQRTHVYRFRRPGTTPSVQTLVKLARAAGVSVDYLATGADEPMPQPDPYPNRKRAMAAARTFGFSERSVRSALKIDPGLDQPERWWLTKIVQASDGDTG